MTELAEETNLNLTFNLTAIYHITKLDLCNKMVTVIEPWFRRRRIRKLGSACQKHSPTIISLYSVSII